MITNKYQINLSTLDPKASASTINIQISSDHQLVDQSEIIEEVFVKKEIEKAINPILDYEKVRFLPLNTTNNIINTINYVINLNGNTNYGSIGFTDEDIRFGRNNFKETFINLGFYDTDNPLDQKLISNITLFSQINSSTFFSVNTIPLIFSTSSPILNVRGFSEGYHLYDYKDELKIGDFKYLYMRATFNNAKSGKSTNLMNQLAPDTIDNLVHKLYTRYKLFRDTTGFYYKIDETYHGDGSIGSNNVSYLGNSVSVNLYQIKAL